MPTLDEVGLGHLDISTIKDANKLISQLLCQAIGYLHTVLCKKKTINSSVIFVSTIHSHGPIRFLLLIKYQLRLGWSDVGETCDVNI